MNTGHTSEVENRHLRIRRITDHDRATVCAVRGELDLGTAPALQRWLDDYARAEHGRLVLDLSDVVFCAVAGIAVVDEAARQARVDRRWLAVVGSRAVRRIARLTDGDETIRWYPSLAAAIEAAAVEPRESAVPEPRQGPPVPANAHGRWCVHRARAT